MATNIDITPDLLTQTSPTHVCCERSDLGGNSRPETVTLVNPHSRKRFPFKYVATHRDQEGEVEAWTYKFVTRMGRCFEMTIFND
jgi:hypothetical protein